MPNSRVPGTSGPPDALSRRSGSYGTAAAAPQPGFGPSLWQNTAAAGAAGPRRHQLAVTSEIQPIPLQQLSAPPAAGDELSVGDIRRASFVTAVPERPSAALRRQRKELQQGARQLDAEKAAPGQQQRRRRSLERPPLPAAAGPPRSSGPGGAEQSLESAQERRHSLQQERRASLEHHRQQLLQRRSGGIADTGDGFGTGPTLEGLPRPAPLRRSSSSEREHVRCKSHPCSMASLLPTSAW